MKLAVKKHHSTKTLAECLEISEGDPIPSGYEQTTLEAFEAWKEQELQAGWKPDGIAIDDEPVPEVIGPAQLRLALWRQLAVTSDAVAQRIAAMQDTNTRIEATIYWEHATEFRRDHPLLAPLAAALGVDNAGIDAIFRAGAKL